MNPDENDRIVFEYPDDAAECTLTVEEQSVDVWQNSIVSRLEDTTFGPVSYGDWEWQSDYHVQDFLGGYAGRVFTADKVAEFLIITEYIDERGPSVNVWHYVFDEEINGQRVLREEYAVLEGIGILGSGWDGEYDREYDFSRAKFVSDVYHHVNPDGTESWGAYRYYYFERPLGPDDPILEHGDWFIAGGGLDGSRIVLGPDPVTADVTGLVQDGLTDWLLVA